MRLVRDHGTTTFRFTRRQLALQRHATQATTTCAEQALLPPVGRRRNAPKTTSRPAQQQRRRASHNTGLSGRRQRGDITGPPRDRRHGEAAWLDHRPARFHSLASARRRPLTTKRGEHFEGEKRAFPRAREPAGGAVGPPRDWERRRHPERPEERVPARV